MVRLGRLVKHSAYAEKETHVELNTDDPYQRYAQAHTENVDRYVEAARKQQAYQEQLARLQNDTKGVGVDSTLPAPPPPPLDQQKLLNILWDFKDSARRRHMKPSHIMHYGQEYLTMYPLKWIELCINVVWVGILWVVLVGKNASDGPWLYYHYFTNWMWTMNVVFYTVDLATYTDWTGTAQFFWIYVAWWPFFGNVCQVFVLVFPLLYINPAILIDTADEIGWSSALIGERLVHVIPFFRAILWLLLRQRDIVDVLGHFWWHKARDRKFFIGYLMMVLVGANGIIIIYCLNHDFRRVYGVDIQPFASVFLIELIFFLSIVLPVVVMSPLGLPLRHHAYHRRTMPLFLTAEEVQKVSERSSILPLFDRQHSKTSAAGGADSHHGHYGKTAHKADFDVNPHTPQKAAAPLVLSIGRVVAVQRRRADAQHTAHHGQVIHT